MYIHGEGCMVSIDLLKECYIRESFETMNIIVWDKIICWVNMKNLQLQLINSFLVDLFQIHSSYKFMVVTNLTVPADKFYDIF